MGWVSCVLCLVAQLYLTLAPLSIGFLQARILEWIAMPSSRRSSQTRDQTQVSCTAGDSLTSEPPGKPKNTGMGCLSLLQGNFPTQESNWDLLHQRQILYQLSYQRSPSVLYFNTILTHSACFSSTFTKNRFWHIFMKSALYPWVKGSVPQDCPRFNALNIWSILLLFDKDFFLWPNNIIL